MSTIKETIMVPQEVNYTVCDECAERKPAGAVREGWVSWPKQYTFDSYDFCSMRCLAEWAARQTERQHALETGEAMP